MSSREDYERGFVRQAWVLLLIWAALIGMVIAVTVFASAPPSTGFMGEQYVYQEDPCVEALQMAMATMEPFIPAKYKKHADGYWRPHPPVTESDQTIQEYLDARAVWREAKLQCWRH